MIEFLVQAAGVIAVIAVVTWWRSRRARRIRSALEAGGTTSVAVWLRQEGDRRRAGTLALTPGRAVWTRRWGRAHVDLGGAQVLSVAPSTGWDADPDAFVLRLLLPTGSSAELLVDGGLADLLAQTLPRASAGVGVESGAEGTAHRRPPGRAWWGWLLVGAGLLWAAYVVCCAVTGYSATATVVSGDRDPDDGFCPVVWEDPTQHVHHGEADCYDDPPGTPLRVRVTGWPDAGDPTMPETYVLIGVLFGLPPLAAGTWRLLHLRGRRQAWLSLSTSERDLMFDPTTPLPPLTVADVVARPSEQASTVVSRLAPYAARQLPRSGWSRPGRPAGARTPVPLLAWLPLLWVPAFVAAMVLLVTWPWPERWLALSTHETATVTGTSTGDVVVDGAGPLPGELTVRFPLPDGTEQRADVATSAELPEGREIRVVYSVDDPRWARLDGEDDDLGQGALIAALVVLLCLAVAGWRISLLVSWRVRVGRVQSTAPRPALGLLTADPAGAPLLLLTDPVVVPLRFTAVPLARPLPSGAVASALRGEPFSVHGELRDGQTVVVRVPDVDAPLLPRAPASGTSASGLLALLDAAHALTREDDPVGRPAD